MNLQVVLERDVNGASAPRRADRDQDIPEALRRRDPAAAERLATRYGERAYRLACRITRNGPDAEDVVQDAFWTVVRKIDTFRGESAFGTWLYRIVANAAYLKLRGGKNRRHEISLDAVLPCSTSAVATPPRWPTGHRAWRIPRSGPSCGWRSRPRSRSCAPRHVLACGGLAGVAEAAGRPSAGRLTPCPRIHPTLRVTPSMEAGSAEETARLAD